MMTSIASGIATIFANSDVYSRRCSYASAGHESLLEVHHDKFEVEVQDLQQLFLKSGIVNLSKSLLIAQALGTWAAHVASTIQDDHPPAWAGLEAMARHLKLPNAFSPPSLEGRQGFWPEKSMSCQSFLQVFSLAVPISFRETGAEVVEKSSKGSMSSP